MKAIFSLRNHSYLKTIGTLLIAIALIAGVVGCTPTTPTTYEVTMAADPTIGGTATDETGASSYERDDVVDIKAVPADCYRFVSWEATPAVIFGNATAPVTTFTMPASDVTITANFAPMTADHFKFYFAEWPGDVPPDTFPVEVQLKDQFGTFNAEVGEVVAFGNPVKKVHDSATAPIQDRDRHYTFYYLEHDEGWMPSSFQVKVNNQFTSGDEDLTVWGPIALAVPTQKEDQEMSDCIDHLLIYNIQHPVEYVPEPIGAVVDLYDQFHEELDVTVYDPMFFANPVEKTIIDTGEVTPTKTNDHYVFYDISMNEEEFEKSGLQITNQFGAQILDIYNPALLAVPSQKISWEQPLNHFKTYVAEWPSEPPPLWLPPLPVDVQLEDQFVTINATVFTPYFFANPVEKRRIVEEKEEITPIWDPKDHLTFYSIDYLADPQVWEVTVNNQFGNDQMLVIAGPYLLAVPTGKLTPDWPEDLNHFLVYEVIDYGVYLPEEIYIYDQFIEGATIIHNPVLFAVPAQKIHPVGGPVTPIVDDEHLVFYGIDGIYPWEEYNLPITNQFGEQFLDVFEDEGNLLGVPSQKISWEGPYPLLPPE